MKGEIKRYFDWEGAPAILVERDADSTMAFISRVMEPTGSMPVTGTCLIGTKTGNPLIEIVSNPSSADRQGAACGAEYLGSSHQVCPEDNFADQ